MVARGRVQDGVVVLPAGVHLPEGLEVTVIVAGPESPQGHGILDIPSVCLGSMVRALTADDDLLGDMLDGRS